MQNYSTYCTPWEPCVLKSICVPCRSVLETELEVAVGRASLRGLQEEVVALKEQMAEAMRSKESLLHKHRTIQDFKKIAVRVQCQDFCRDFSNSCIIKETQCGTKCVV